MNMTTGREPRGCLQASFVWVCYNARMECCARILDQLASIGWQGAVKFVFDGGKIGQVIESQTQAIGAIPLDDLQDAKALLNIAGQVSFTGYIVVFLAQDIRATYVRTQTAASLDSTMTFERAFAMRSREAIA